MMKWIFASLAVLVSMAMPISAAELGGDGLHKTAWQQDTFKDMTEDLAEANAQGKRLLVIFEQRGCIYCTKMYEEVFVKPEIEALLTDDYFVVQMNLFGDVEVTDFDGTVLPEKDMASRWGVVFTPTMIFLPQEVAADMTAAKAAVVTMPGAFGPQTTRALLTWIKNKGYESEEHFQKYLARTMSGTMAD
jgi:thioredoxin-related protein